MGIEVTPRSTESRAPAPSSSGGEAAAGFGALLGSMDLPAEEAGGGDASTAALPPQHARPDPRGLAKVDKADKADKTRRPGADTGEEGDVDGDGQDTARPGGLPQAMDPWLVLPVATQPLADGSSTLEGSIAATADAGPDLDMAAALPGAATAATLALPAARGLRADTFTGTESARATRAPAATLATAAGAPTSAAAQPGGPAGLPGLSAARQNGVAGQGREAPQPLSLQGGTVAEPEPSLSAALQALTQEGGVGRRLAQAEGRGEELRTPGGGWQPEGVASRHALSADAPLPVAGTGVDTAGAGMDERMDAQMSYWLSQKTHNAELTLDTQDGRSVEVSIALNGREAQVAFRAEQAGTRELLGSALPQLREALDAQGLLLAGVTVDSFGARGQGGDAGQGDAARQGRGGAAARTVTLEGVPAAGLQGTSARVGAAGRGLDLYV